jgi:hypothetical protein
MLYETSDTQNDIIQSLNNFIDNNNIPHLNDNDLHPSLKSIHIPNAINLIKEFVNDQNKVIQIYGATSSGMTNHIVFRRNGLIYNAFCSMTHGLYAVSLAGPDIVNKLFPYYEYF